MNINVRTGISALGRVAIVSMVSTCLARTALAEEVRRETRAETLFREGKALLGGRDYPRACPLLAASFELDPATGTLLALAICHEGEGKLASAAAEYRIAARRAKTEGRTDRERVALERAIALEHRVSTLAIVPPPEAWNTGNFVIRRSGVAVERDDWGKPIALDGGEHVIEASAPGRKPWRAAVTLAPNSERRTVSIPPLEPIASTQPEPSAARPTASPQPGREANQRTERMEPGSTQSTFSSLQLVGIVGMVAGTVGIGVGTFYAFQALSKYEHSNQNGCQGDTCVGQGKEDRLAARSAGNTATVCFGVGASLAVGGILMFVLGGASDDASATTALPVQPRISVESRRVVLSFDGRF